MPAARTLQVLKYRFSLFTRLEKNGVKRKAGMVPVVVATEGEIVDLADCMHYYRCMFALRSSVEYMALGDVEYPLDDNVRQIFKTEEGKVRCSTVPEECNTAFLMVSEGHCSSMGRI